MTTAIGTASQRYAGFKAAVFTLLVCNAALYLFFGTLSETLDAAAWLVLLALFELETGFGERFRGKSASAAIHATRLAAAVAVCAAAIGYVNHNEWLDALNSGLWIAVVVLLEFEVRHPLGVARPRDTSAEHPVAGTGAEARCRAWFAAAAATLYAGLAALILVWAWRGEWFDAYDAALWLTAFATIEMNVLRIPRKDVAA